MYHIKQHRRTQNSAQLLYEALLRIMDETPFEEITVTQVLRESTVSRSTFYRNFDRLSDVLIWKLDSTFETYSTQFLEKMNALPSPLPKDLLLRYFFTFWYENKEILHRLKQANRMDDIYPSFIQRSKPLTQAFLPELELDSVQYQYYISMKAGLVMGIFNQWVERGMTETPHEVLQITIQNLKLQIGRDFLF